MAGARKDLWLIVIGVGKLIKVAVLVTAGILALRMASNGAEELHHWIVRMGISPGNHLVHEALAKAGGLDHKDLARLGVGTFIYAGLFAIEGIGLLARKRWAEYFTIVITGSFIPLEIYETVHHFTAMRVVTIVLNVAAVIYLVYHLRHTRRESHAPPRASKPIIAI